MRRARRPPRRSASPTGGDRRRRRVRRAARRSASARGTPASGSLGLGRRRRPSRRIRRGCGSGSKSTSASDSFSPPTPSVIVWCIFWSIAVRPPSSPSITRELPQRPRPVERLSRRAAPQRSSSSRDRRRAPGARRGGRGIRCRGRDRRPNSRRHDAQRRADDTLAEPGDRRDRVADRVQQPVGVGRRSRIVRLQKSERSAGSFSTAHMIASVSDIRTSTVRAPSSWSAQRGTRVCLNSLRPVHSSEVEHAVEVVGAAAFHEPDEHRLVRLTMNVGHAEHAQRSTARCARRRASSAAGRSRPRPRPRRRRGRPTSRSRAARSSLRSSGPRRGGPRTTAMCESRKWSGNSSRTAMPHERAARRCPTRLGVASQTGGSPSSTWTWSSENGQEAVRRCRRPRAARRPPPRGALRAKGQR